MTQFQLVSTTYRNVSNKPVITVYGRDISGNSIVKDVSWFRPYLYVRPKDYAYNEVVTRLKGFEEVEEILDDFKFLPMGYQTDRSPVLKVYTKRPGDVPKIRDALLTRSDIDGIYDADILFASSRFLADENLFGMGWHQETEDGHFVHLPEVPGNAPLRYFSWDIEVLVPEKGAPISTRDQIILISIAMNLYEGHQKTIVLVAKPGTNFDSDNYSIHYYLNEKDLLIAFLNIIHLYDPDVLMGYNINSFDFPYLEDRLQLNGISDAMGRDGSSAQVRSFGSKHEVRITGRIVADLLDLIKQNYSLANYKLGTVASTLLKEDKLDVKASEMRRLWLSEDPKDLSRFIEYSRRDSDLVLSMAVDLKILDKYIAISKECGCLLHDVLNSGQQVKIESMLLHEFVKEGRMFPLKKHKEEGGDKESTDHVQGAHVFEPERGLHENLIIMDFKSLYPSCIRSYNICWSTIVDGDVSKLDVLTPPNNVHYVSHETYHGIMPRILTNLYNKRLEFKKKLKEAQTQQDKDFYDAAQYSVKILLNSFYGYTGAESGRFFDPRLANSITAIGRETIQLTQKTAESLLPCKIIGGDSVTSERFVTLRNTQGHVVIRNIEKLFNELAASYEIQQSNGKEYVPCNGEYEALSIDKQKQVKWSKLSYVMRHLNSKRIFRVVQKYGETRVTEDHSLIIDNEIGIDVCKPEYMQRQHIAHCKINLHTNCNLKNIDLYEYLKNYSYDTVYKGCTKTSKFRIVNDRWLQFGWTNQQYPILVKRFIEGEDLERLCRLIGAFASEGSATNATTTSSCDGGACISCCDVEWLEQLRKDYLSIFKNVRSSKIIPSMQGMSKYLDHEYKDNTYVMQMGNKIASAVFGGLCGFGSRNKRLPDFVFNLSKDHIKIIYDNLVKGDGYIGPDNLVEYCSISLELISDVSILMNMLNKKFSIYRGKAGDYSIKELKHHHDDNQISTKIIEEPYDGYVYDLTVENEHTFADSCGNIFLHNTDSIFLKLLEVDTPEGGQQAAKLIHSQMLSLLPPPMEIDFEAFAKRALIFQKKRYCMWIFEPSKDGFHDKLKMRGIETRRRDWCPLVGETMTKVLEMILKEGRVEESRIYALDVINNVKRLHDVNSNWELAEKLILSKQLSRGLDQYSVEMPHVEVCRKMEKRGEVPYGLGDRVSYMVTPGALKGTISKFVDTPEYIKDHGGAIDTTWYVEKQLLPPISRVFDALNIDIFKGAPIKRQSSLFSF